MAISPDTVLKLLPTLADITKGKQVSTTGSTSQQTLLTPEANNALLRQILGGTQGLASVSGAQSTAGLYNSSTNSLLINDLLTKAAGEVAIKSAPTVTNTANTVNQQPQTSFGGIAQNILAPLALKSLLSNSGAGDTISNLLGFGKTAASSASNLLAPGSVESILGAGSEAAAGGGYGAAAGVEEALGLTGGASTAGGVASVLGAGSEAAAGGGYAAAAGAESALGLGSEAAVGAGLGTAASLASFIPVAGAGIGLAYLLGKSLGFFGEDNYTPEEIAAGKAFKLNMQNQQDNGINLNQQTLGANNG